MSDHVNANDLISGVHRREDARNLEGVLVMSRYFGTVKVQFTTKLPVNPSFHLPTAKKLCQRKVQEVLETVEWDDTRWEQVSLDLEEIPTATPTLENVLYLQSAGWEQKTQGQVLWWLSPGSKTLREYTDALRIQSEKDRGDSK